MNIYFIVMYFTTFFSGLSFGLCLYFEKSRKLIIITFLLAVIFIFVSQFCLIKMFQLGVI